MFKKEENINYKNYKTNMKNKDIISKIIKAANIINQASRKNVGEYIILPSYYMRILEK